jgi:site-specific recombinase XerC
LKISDESEGRAVVSIMNSAGIKVMEFQAENMNDEILKEIPVKSLNKGIYVVQVLIDNKDLYFTKIVVVK